MHYIGNRVGLFQKAQKEQRRKKQLTKPVAGLFNHDTEKLRGRKHGPSPRAPKLFMLSSGPEPGPDPAHCLDSSAGPPEASVVDGCRFRRAREGRSRPGLDSGRGSVVGSRGTYLKKTTASEHRLLPANSRVHITHQTHPLKLGTAAGCVAGFRGRGERRLGSSNEKRRRSSRDEGSQNGGAVLPHRQEERHCVSSKAGSV
ncbi:hypothetical protein HPB50_027338 [Hyalomma asiaticum]|uniref:Uncharacterized protein n=1 Tax=Hyalomma asiaticum TaxID=266040 RepID=A0ACB7T570_HYAAI|nr:hypothetical protein HPB50_027338 [Hyalomma asiaticum]